MRTSIVTIRAGAIVAAALAAACHGGAPPAGPAPSNHPATAAPPAAAAPTGGTSGLGLDWAAPRAAVLAAYPDAVVADDGASAHRRGPHEGRAATWTFELGPDGALAGVGIAFDGGYVSMEQCAATWRTMRAALDAELGRSQADNLAAYWTTATTAITLACDPTDAGGATMSMRYAPPPRD